MKIEWTNKKDGTRVKNKNFPYLQDGKAVGASYDKIIFDCQKEDIDQETTNALIQKLEAWHKTTHNADKAGTIILFILTICVIPFILVPVLYFAFQVYLPTGDYKMLIPLLLITLVALLAIWFMAKGLKQQKSASTKTDQLYQEAKTLVACDTPELFSCRIIEKQWYEAVDEADCYFLNSEHLTFRVDLSKYEQTKKGDCLTLALMSTKDDHLLFVL